MLQKVVKKRPKKHHFWCFFHHFEAKTLYILLIRASKGGSKNHSKIIKKSSKKHLSKTRKKWCNCGSLGNRKNAGFLNQECVESDEKNTKNHVFLVFCSTTRWFRGILHYSWNTKNHIFRTIFHRFQKSSFHVFYVFSKSDLKSAISMWK